MNRFLSGASSLLFLLTISLPIAVVSAQEKDTKAIRVMSFNIRTAQLGAGPNRWEARREALLSLIQEHSPDILGCQEVSPAQRSFLEQRLELRVAVQALRHVGETGAGLVARVVPLAELQAEALKTAETIAGMAPLAALACKEMVNAAFETTLQQGVVFERRLFHGLFGSQDQKEGMAAFIEKRPGNWTGK